MRELEPSARAWLEYQAAGETLLALWRGAMRRSLACARSGVAAWDDCAESFSAVLFWSARTLGNELRFVGLCEEELTDWTRGSRQAHPAQ